MKLKLLESLVVGQFSEQPDIKIVSLDSPEHCIAINVTAAKVPKTARRGGWYIASSVLLISKAKSGDTFVTHNVIAEPDLRLLAITIASAAL
jgi:hypothetical protein